MPFPAKIEQTLAQYDNQKGWKRYLMGDAKPIAAIKKLSESERSSLLNIYRCFPKDQLDDPNSLSTWVFGMVLNIDLNECCSILTPMSESPFSYFYEHSYNVELPSIPKERLQYTLDLLNIIDARGFLIEKVFCKILASIGKTYNSLDSAVLRGRGFITLEYFDYISETRYATDALMSIHVLRMAKPDLLNQENWAAIKRSPALSQKEILPQVLQSLSWCNPAFLNQENFDAVITHCYPRAVAYELTKLYGISPSLVTSENRKLIQQYIDKNFYVIPPLKQLDDIKYAIIKAALKNREITLSTYIKVWKKPKQLVSDLECKKYVGIGYYVFSQLPKETIITIMTFLLGNEPKIQEKIISEFKQNEWKRMSQKALPSAATLIKHHCLLQTEDERDAKRQYEFDRRYAVVPRK